MYEFRWPLYTNLVAVGPNNNPASLRNPGSRHHPLTHQRDEIALEETQLILPRAQIGEEGPREGCVTPSAGAHPCPAAPTASASAVAWCRGRHGPRPWRGFRYLCENNKRGGRKGGERGGGTINPAHFVICAWRDEGCVWDARVEKDFSQNLGWDGSFRNSPSLLRSTYYRIFLRNRAFVNKRSRSKEN